MARVNLRCACGFFFAVPDTQLAAGVKCPSCMRPVGTDGPVGPAPRAASGAGPKGTVTVSGKMLALIGGGAAAFVILVIVILVAMSGGSNEDSSPKQTAPSPWKTEARTTPRTDSAKGQASSSKAPIIVIPSTAPRPAFVPDTTPPPGDRPAASPPSSSPTALALAAELQARTRELLSLPTFYRDLCVTSEERIRVEPWVTAGKATPEETQVLETLLQSAKVRTVLEERALVKDSLSRLEKESVDSLPTDRVTMTDGRVMNGRIVEETAETIRLERKLASGVGGMMNLKKAEIKELQKGKGIGVDFKARWTQAGQGTPADRLALLEWCRGNALVGQAKLVAFLILTNDPGSPAARAEAGLPANPVQVAAELAAQGGAILWQGKNWAPKELKDRLLKDGYALINGEWFSRKDRMISIPGLFRYDRQDDKPVLITSSSAPVNHETETSWKVVQDVQSNTFKEMPELKLLRRFYAPTLAVRTTSSRSEISIYKDVENRIDKPEPPAGKVLTGEVFISVPLNQPIVEASVMTLAETKGGATITIHLLVSNGERIKLYQCGAKEDDTHKLPDQVRGQTGVELVAVISMPAAYTSKTSKRDVTPLKMDQKARVVVIKELDVVHEQLTPDFKAMLFPSHSNTYECFRLKAVVGEPAPVLNKLFADVGATELLKEPK